MVMTKMERARQEHRKTGLLGWPLWRHLTQKCGIKIAKSSCGKDRVLLVKDKADPEPKTDRVEENNGHVKPAKKHLIQAEHLATGLTGPQLRIHCVAKHGDEFNRCADSYFYASSFGGAKLGDVFVDPLPAEKRGVVPITVPPQPNQPLTMPSSWDEVLKNSVFPSGQVKFSEIDAKQSRRRQVKTEQPAGACFCPRCGLNLKLFEQAFAIASEEVES